MVKLLAGKPIKFYDIFTPSNSFALKRRIVDTSEIEACGLKSPAFLDLRMLDNLDESDA
jgi:hypothetical protein